MTTCRMRRVTVAKRVFLQLEKESVMKEIVTTGHKGTSFTNQLVRMAIGLSLVLLAAGHASAQYGGGGGTGGGSGSGSGGGTYTAPSGGYGSTGKAVGIGVGAAAGAGILIYALHHHAAVTGCVMPAEDGLRIVDEKKNASYALQSGDVLLKAGQHVQLQGKKSKTDGGAPTFLAKKLVKDLGSCSVPSTAAQAQPSAQ